MLCKPSPFVEQWIESVDDLDPEGRHPDVQIAGLDADRRKAGRPDRSAALARYGCVVPVVDVATLAERWPVDGLERVERCPACGSTDRRVLYAGLRDRSYRSAPGEWLLFRCDRCECAYLDPRPDTRTAALAYRTYYDGGSAPLTTAPTHGWRRLRRALRNGYLNANYGYALSPAVTVGRTIVPLLPRYRELADEHVRHLRARDGHPRILDVGCGEAQFLIDMQSLGWAIEGIEPNAEAVAVARARGVPTRHGNLHEQSLDPRSFDAITFRLVLEHMRDPVSALAKCHRSLKPGGTLWIATPSLNADAHRIFGRDWIHLEPPRHVVLYTSAGLTRLLRNVGFEVNEVRPLRQARWSFRLSQALARGLAPFENAPPLSSRLALHARLTDMNALRQPERADVIVIIARAV
jgi:SAM-dependent methyltransferase